MESKLITNFEDLQVISLLDQTHQQAIKVYLCKHNNQYVVAKVISRTTLSDTKQIEHLRNQKAALQRFTTIQHPNINHIKGTFKDSQSLCLLLQPVEGLPLHKLMQMVGGKFNPNMVKLMAFQAAWILHDFHAQGFVYRDIKASNFMVNKNLKLTLLDLGKAKDLRSCPNQRTNTLCGTPHAIPPQVLIGGGCESYSFDFDCYGYGVLLYELTTGKTPYGYETNTISKNMQNGLNQEVLFKDWKDKHLISLITSLLNPDPFKRLGARKNKEQGLKNKQLFEEILQHEYFKQTPETQQGGNTTEAEAKIFFRGEGTEEMIKKWRLTQYRTEVEDFGVQCDRYEAEEGDLFYDF